MIVDLVMPRDVIYANETCIYDDLWLLNYPEMPLWRSQPLPSSQIYIYLGMYYFHVGK